MIPLILFGSLPGAGPCCSPGMSGCRCGDSWAPPSPHRASPRRGGRAGLWALRQRRGAVPARGVSRPQATPRQPAAPWRSPGLRGHPAPCFQGSDREGTRPRRPITTRPEDPESKKDTGPCAALRGRVRDARGRGAGRSWELRREGQPGPVLSREEAQWLFITGCYRISMAGASQIGQGMIKGQNARHCEGAALCRALRSCHSSHCSLGPCLGPHPLPQTYCETGTRVYSSLPRQRAAEQWSVLGSGRAPGEGR